MLEGSAPHFDPATVVEHSMPVSSPEPLWPDTQASFETVTDARGDNVLRVHGQIDVHTAPGLRRELVALTDEGATSIVVDGRDLEFIDSSGLRVIVEASSRFQARGGRLLLRNLRPSVRLVFELSALDRLLLIAD
jgi:anti-sigma B factor antagonist